MTLSVVSLLAYLAESIVEYFFAWAPKWTKYIAAAVGILLAINFQMDLFQSLLGLESFHPLVGYVLTGLVLGRGSNWLHDLWNRFIADPLGS